MNKHIVSYENEPHGVDVDILHEIFESVNLIDEQDTKKRIIRKAAWFVAGITYEQPFKEGNRRTSYYLLKNFLGRNGYTIRFYDESEEDEFAELLENTTALHKQENDPRIYSDVEDYLTQKVENMKFDYL